MRNLFTLSLFTLLLSITAHANNTPSKEKRAEFGKAVEECHKSLGTRERTAIENCLKQKGFEKPKRKTL